MKGKIIIITALITLAFIAPNVFGLTCGLNEEPQFPHIFNGTAYFANGTAAPSDITVRAELNGETFTIQTTSNGVYGTSSTFLVFTCGVASNKTITFYLSGQATSNTSTYVPDSRSVNFNIVFASSSPLYCGDGICNDGEMIGNNNIYPYCSKDCVAGGTRGPSGGGGGGGGGGAPSGTGVNYAKGNANITISSIEAGNTANVMIAKYEDIDFRQVNVSVSNSVNNIKIVITKLPDEPASVTHTIEGKVYHYIQVDKTNFTDSDVSKVFIKFAVNKSWFTVNGVDKTNISLYRWVNDKWTELITTYLSEDAYEVFYQAESPGFSYFLIGTKSGEIITPPTCTENWSCTDWSACINNQQSRTCIDSNACGTTVNKPVETETCIMKEEIGAENMWMYYSVAAVIIIIIAAMLFVFRKKITKSSRSKK